MSVDYDGARCPYCDSQETDLWEHDWDPVVDSFVHTECGHCGKPITIRRLVAVTYEIEKRRDA